MNVLHRQCSRENPWSDRQNLIRLLQIMLCVEQSHVRCSQTAARLLKMECRHRSEGFSLNRIARIGRDRGARLAP